MFLEVKPNPALVDQEININVKSLAPGQHITLRCFTVERKVLYTSHAHFVADLDGEVDTKRSGSFGGCYTGISQMGLFWSMQAVNDKGEILGARYIRLVSEPSEFVFQVFNGHISRQDILKKERSDACLERIILRSNMAPGVTRHDVNHGRLRGTIFKPKGVGPFKGVIDVFGGNGGLVESRAALIASHGFVTYALPYMNLKEMTVKLDLELFLEASDYFQSLEYVQPGISAIGLSFGASIMLFVSTLPESCIKNVVAISGIHYPSWVELKGKPYPPVEYDIVDAKKEFLQDKNGAYDVDFYIYDEEISAPYTTPLEKSPRTTKYLFVIGEEDKNARALKSYNILRNRMIKHGKEDQMAALVYPNVGHFIDPPNLPQTIYGYYFNFYGLTVTSGGEMVANAAACAHAWPEILKFLEKNTGFGSKL